MVLMFTDCEELEQKLWGLQAYFQSCSCKTTYIQQVCIPVYAASRPLPKELPELKHSAVRISQWDFLLYLRGKSEQTEF